MMDTKEELFQLISQQEEKPFDVKEFLLKLIPYWYWFVISGVIGLAIAFLVTKYTPQTYSVSSLILIKENEKSGLSMENMFNNFQLSSDVNIENHIGILTSYSINRRVVENLGWQVFWHKSMFLNDYNLYGQEPYSVSFDPGDRNLVGVPVFIKKTENNKYLVSVDAEVNINGIEQKIEFEKEGETGRRFKSKYFNFTLNEKRASDDDEYYFVFNNMDRLALTYKNKLNASAVNKKANLIQLQVEGQSPVAEIQYLNELTNVYIQYGLSEKNLTSENTIWFIDEQLSAIVDTLKTTSDSFSNYRSTNKIYNLGEKASLVVGKIEKLESKKSIAQIQLNYYENLSKYLDDADKFKKMVAPSVVGINDATLNELVSKMITLYSKKESLSFSLQEKNPSIQIIDSEVDYMKKSLAENLKNLVFNTTQELQSIEEDIGNLNKELENYPKAEQELINIKRMYDLNNDLYTFMLQKRAEAEITKASNVPDVKVIDPASSTTYVKTGPNKLLNLVIGLFLGLIIPFLIIIAKDFFDETVHSQEDIEKLTSIPIASSIPHNSHEQTIPIIKYPRSLIAESFRELRTKLDYLYRKKGTKIIGVQSAVSSEGKTFISLNLATIIALNNKKVILIGADMRKPTLHKELGVDNKKGLSTYLVGYHEIEQIIKATKIKNLDLISSGVIPPNPAELLESPRFEQLIEVLKKEYDAIVFDNAPISMVTEGTIVRRYTGLDLFITRQGYTHKKLIEFIDKLAENNSKTAIVFNDVSTKKYGGNLYLGKYYKKMYYSSEGYYDSDSSKK